MNFEITTIIVVDFALGPGFSVGEKSKKCNQREMDPGEQEVPVVGWGLLFAFSPHYGTRGPGFSKRPVTFRTRKRILN